MRKISKRKDRNQDNLDLGVAVGKLSCGHLYYGVRVSNGLFVMCIPCHKARQVVS